MTHRERIEFMVTVTLCSTLIIATCAVAYHGPKVAKEVSLALLGQWAILAAMVREWMKRNGA